MSEAETVTQVTPHGEIEYEAVECMSCKRRVMKKDAWSVELEEPEDTQPSVVTVETEGWACPECVNDGVTDWPDPMPGSVIAALFRRTLYTTDGHGSYQFSGLRYMVTVTVVCLLVLGVAALI